MTAQLDMIDTIDDVPFASAEPASHPREITVSRPASAPPAASPANPPPPAAPQSESAAVLAMIERFARDPSIDIARIERLMDMKREMDREVARRAYNAAMADCQREMPQVARKAENTQTRSLYATLEAIAEAIAPVYTRQGFSLSFDTGDSPLEGHLRIKCLVSHSEGFEREYHVDIPIDGAGLKGNSNKTATHAFGSTVSYGRRYLTLMIFNIATKKATPDDDGNAAGNAQTTSRELISDEEVEWLRSELMERNVNLSRFYETLKITRIEDLTKHQLIEAKQLFAERDRRKAQTGERQ